MKKALCIITLAFIILSIVPGYAGGTRVTAIEASYGDSFILTNDGTVWGWGYNLCNQIGNSSVTGLISYYPVQSNITNVKQVSTSNTATVVLKNDGTVWSWGYYSAGQMGNGYHPEYDPHNKLKYQNDPYNASRNSSAEIPVKADISNVKKVSAGISFTLALKNDGTVWEWGSGGAFTDYSLLHKENYSDPISHITFMWSPIQVEGLSDITDIKAGHEHAVALDSEGRVWFWGTNISNGSNYQDRGLISTPIQVQISDVKAITAGSGFSLALKNDGTVWGWGDDTFGELGDGGSFSWFSTTPEGIYRQTPVMVQGITDVVAIYSSDVMCMALKKDGTVWEWGRIDTSNVYTTPVRIPIDNVVAIACGTGFSLALKNDGTVWSWGDNSRGSLGRSGSSSDPAQVPLDNIQASGSSIDERSGQQANNGDPGNSLGNMISPAVAIALIAAAVIVCGIAYYVKKNR
jgi:alpha-tubulin suppressor-like RCC1 family protein